MSMFCPDCRGLLKVKKKGSGNEKYCPKCAGAGTHQPEELIEDFPVMPQNFDPLGNPDIPFFPFAQVRPGQDQFILDVGQSIAERKHLFAYAPTGIGKTVAALVPAVEASLRMNKVVCFLTSKQSQHHIAIETLRQMKAVSGKDIRVVDLISKQAMCPSDISEEFPAAFRMLCFSSIMDKSCKYHSNNDPHMVKFVHSNIMHVEELKDLSTRRQTCTHKVAMEAAKEANVIVCDYNHIFDPVVRPQMLEAFDRPLEDFIIIVDEAHNLPDRIRGYYTMSLTPNILDEAISEVKDRNLEAVLKGLGKDLTALLDSVDVNKEELTESGALLDKFKKRLEMGFIEKSDLDTFIGDLQKIAQKRYTDGRNSQAAQVAEFLDHFRKEMNGLIRIISKKDGSLLYYRLLDPSVVAEPIFSQFHSSVVMSGTLYPTQVYGDILGIPDGKRMLKTYKSPFPEENRPVFVAEDVTTLYSQRGDAMYRKIAARINEASSAVPGNVAVFFQSYGMLKNILQHVKTTKQNIIESRESSKAEKRSMVSNLIKLKAGNGGLLLAVMGGSMSEGIDYKDNLLDCVIVVGLPLAPPSLEQDMLIKYYDTKFGYGNGRDYGYTYPAMSRVLQSMGRCIRSETDRAAVILMDKRFLYPMYRKCFPGDMVFKSADNLDTRLRAFFRG
ncbi:MAG: DEAD/DEAH box helicase family protein [Candidatus Thermoplasmatota archaeon]|nr:hypothetical protein [Euryarchaeota archaeon]MBU4031446.1 DEAD/DEAH box helicase family protein [Candidatus Thermoplasmatota archaeon]MBU4071957.1 DEAD/DEAH box helicase family protein [Candidatus Thermoplasmatota archaeon]MBU4143641.1 DEAD/DEAH box helicase family protein [Candidatus Thermoplasmatota archaeon]MBU4591301.1 DEAD/DEAH box helicase family protein [Candidatus Thermoplasmatota archaeon]